MKEWLVLLLLLARIAGFIGISPLIFPKQGLTPVVKAFFALILAFLLMPVVSNGFASERISENFLGLLVKESFTGMLMGFITLLFANLYVVAGQFIDLTSGLGAATLFNPLTQSNAGIIANFLYMYGMLNFLVADGHHRLLTLLAESYKLLPLGVGIFNLKMGELLLKIFSLTMLVALEVAIPFMMVMVITDLALGILSRTAPQLNVFMLSFALKILLTIFTLWLLLPGLAYFSGIFLKIAENNLLQFIRGIGYGG